MLRNSSTRTWLRHVAVKLETFFGADGGKADLLAQTQFAQSRLSGLHALPGGGVFFQEQNQRAEIESGKRLFRDLRARRGKIEIGADVRRQSIGDRSKGALQPFSLDLHCRQPLLGGGVLFDESADGLALFPVAHVDHGTGARKELGMERRQPA